MILIMPNTLVLLARITVQVSASNVSAAMVIPTHQQQVFSVADFKLMTFSSRVEANYSTDMYILVGIRRFLYE